MKLGILGSGLIVRDVLPLLAAMKQEGKLETSYILGPLSFILNDSIKGNLVTGK